MLKQTSHDFRIRFIFEFTKELIKYSKGEVFVLEKVLDKQKEKIENKKYIESEKRLDDENQEIIQSLKSLEHPILPTGNEFVNSTIPKNSVRNNSRMMPVMKPFVQRMPPARPRVLPQVLRIPEPRLPPQLQYLRPIPVKTEIDLGELNPFIKDPMVREIQCDGANKNILVVGTMGTKKTGVVLSKEEVDEVINKFSEEAKIPVDEGAMRIVVGNLILLAVTSEVVDSKFIIKKMASFGSMLRR